MKKKNWFKNKSSLCSGENTGNIALITDDLVPLDCSSFVGGSLSVVRPSRDGTKLYVGGWNTDVIHQLSSAIPFDNINNFTQDSKTLSVSAQESSLRGFCFSNDGLHIYACGIGANTIFQYDLAVAWDVSTGGYSGKSLVIGASLFDCGISEDGTQIYAWISGALERYTLSTPFDLSTAGSQDYSIILGSSNSVGFFINCNGKEILHTNSTTSIFQKSWLNAWDFQSTIDFSSSLSTLPSSLTNICRWGTDKILTSNRITNDVTQWSLNT
jgi:hypothetical protein